MATCLVDRSKALSTPLFFDFIISFVGKKKKRKEKELPRTFPLIVSPPSSLCQTQQTKSKRRSSILLTEKKFCRLRELVPQLNAFEKIDVLIRLYRENVTMKNRIGNSRVKIHGQLDTRKYIMSRGNRPLWSPAYISPLCWSYETFLGNPSRTVSSACNEFNRYIISTSLRSSKLCARTWIGFSLTDEPRRLVR